MKSLCISVFALVALAVAFPAVPAHSQPVDALQPAPARPTLLFNPNTSERCGWFFISESNVSYVPLDSHEPSDKFMVDDSIGLMKNVGSRNAVGASMDAIIAQGDVHYAPTVRYKRWYGTRSVDLMLGYTSSIENGPTGPILTARYSPARLIHMQVGACRFQELFYPNNDPYLPLEERKSLRVFAGIGFGGVPGVALWGVQAAGLLIAMAALAGDN